MTTLATYMEARFWIGDRCRIGSYEGEVRSVFCTKGGQLFYVVQYDGGNLAIHTPEDISKP